VPTTFSIVPLLTTGLVGAAQPLEAAARLAQPWSDVYANVPAVATTVTAAHLLAVFAGGGLAIAADRRVLTAADGTGPSAGDALAELARTHAAVLAALAIAIVSGGLLAAADLEAFVGSRVFWTKMLVLVLLAANGARLRAAGYRLTTPAPPVGSELAPESGPTPAAAPVTQTHDRRTLRSSARVSLSCWFLLVLLGVILGNG
jgi:hypothetical protein